MTKVIKAVVSSMIMATLIFNSVYSAVAVTVYSNMSYTLSTVPDYTSLPYVNINQGNPYFSDNDYTISAFESYSELDYLGRCGVAYALVCKETMPTDARGSISSITPTGWIQAKYDVTLISGGYLYNRCHLIGWQLTGENANKLNLITGTRYLNIDGMLGFEDSVAEYVKENSGHVLYRVTPVFEGANLLAGGVLMEGYSVDDNGTAINFCVYCYNVQPGIKIDYKTGASYLEIIIEADDKKTRIVFVINKKSGLVHNPDCSSVKKMSEKNKLIMVDTQDYPKQAGLEYCSICKPDEKPTIAGDVDNTGTVTSADARLVLRFAVELEKFSDSQIIISDVDVSGSVNSADARLVLRIAVGLE